ncbi:39S ribosomal protein L53/MRP-L53-domain-containing protein [Rhypophila decipiens]|uniref:Large ribosomal subunit protein mL53 n=1 Tax=Rhypophila decipiens TaxID=261697 RepID=A0AAN6YKL4_9PEZI|nr:39S ribosomal protein L53/MRP-L53-domain-containing protein [Rhypophila decipiens]
MISRFITEVRMKFNPFNARTRSARLFLSNLPPTARADGMMIQTQLLPKASTEASSLYIKFKDGKEMNLDVESMGIKSIVEEVDRHSRQLQKAADLE